MAAVRRRAHPVALLGLINWRVAAGVAVPVWAALAAGLAALAGPDPATVSARAVQPLPDRPQDPSAEVAAEPAPPPRAVVPREGLRNPEAVVLALATTVRDRLPDWPPADPNVPPAVIGGCKTHGTRVKFVRTPAEAFQTAQAKDKLVYLLHLSGNLEDEGFT